MYQIVIISTKQVRGGNSKHLLVFQMPYLMQLLGRMCYTMSIYSTIYLFFIKRSNRVAVLHFPNPTRGTYPGIFTGRVFTSHGTLKRESYNAPRQILND